MSDQCCERDRDHDGNCDKHPSLEALAEIMPILKFFAYSHLPPHLQAVSQPVGELARRMATELPVGPETSAGLRKLLEAKDCFVRAKLDAR